MLCGIDEAGRGAVIGPLVIAIVGIEKKDDLLLYDLKPRDSKTYTKNARENIAEKIKKIVKYEVRVLTPEEIDKKMSMMTLNKIEVIEIAELICLFHPEIVYIDAVDVNEIRFKKDILSRIDFQPEIIAEHNADAKYPIVSCASIIAKIIRDNEIKKLEQKIGMQIGSGYPSDKITRNFLDTLSKKSLPPYIRKSWKTVKNMMNVSLDNYLNS